MYFLAGNSKRKLPFLARPHYIASIPISNFKVCIVWFVIVSLITGLSEVQIGIFTFNSWTLLRTHFDIWLTTWVYTWPTLPHSSQSFLKCNLIFFPIEFHERKFVIKLLFNSEMPYDNRYQESFWLRYSSERSHNLLFTT